jgi:periplasmic mercuric ion binding protein
MKHIVILLLTLGFLASSSFAQTTVIKEVKIKTSAQCDMCKKRIEDGLYKQKGVVSADLNVDAKTVTIKYRGNKVTEDELRTYISSLGYDADHVPAQKEAYDKLPACCQKDGMK